MIDSDNRQPTKYVNHNYSNLRTTIYLFDIALICETQGGL